MMPDPHAAKNRRKDALRCRVLTPDRNVFDEFVDSAELVTVAGTLEVFPRYEPTIAPLAIGVMKAKSGDGPAVSLAVHGGYMDMNGSLLVILADSAETGDEIDVERARRALERARMKLADISGGDAGKAGSDADGAEQAVLRATTRLQAAGEPVPPAGRGL